MVTAHGERCMCVCVRVRLHVRVRVRVRARARARECVCVCVCVFVRVWVVAVTSSICFPMLCERDEFRLGSCCSQSLCAVPPDGGAICLSRAGPPLHFLQTVVPFARHGLPHVCLIASYQQTYCPCANGDVACAGYPPTWFHSTNSIIHCGQ